MPEVRAVLGADEYESLSALAQRLRWSKAQTIAYLLGKALKEWGSAEIVVPPKGILGGR